MVNREQWEYKTLRYPTEGNLSNLGSSGWELVCVLYDSDSGTETAWLKRKKT